MFCANLRLNWGDQYRLKKMEQLPLMTVVFVLCALMPTTASHKLLHAGELINRENAKISLGQLKNNHNSVILYNVILVVVTGFCPVVVIEAGIRVSVYPAKYLSSGDWVKMSWQYVSYPSVYDWIGVYSPPLDDLYLIDPTVQAPIKVQVCCAT